MSEIIGTILSIGGTQEITDKFKKAVVLVSTDEQYPQTIPVEFVNKKLEALPKYKVGDGVKISYNLRGNEWTHPETGEIKHFIAIQAWRIENAQVAARPEQAGTFENIPHDELNPEEHDDLPF